MTPEAPQEPVRHPLWWRMLAYLPEGPLFIACATCLFWRGALVGAALATPLVLLTLKVMS